jgi:hypothetical protein
MMVYLLLDELKPRTRTKKIPQSRLVFAVSLQEHPELLDPIMPLLRQYVKTFLLPLSWAEARECFPTERGNACQGDYADRHNPTGSTAVDTAGSSALLETEQTGTNLRRTTHPETPKATYSFRLDRDRIAA